MQTREKKILVSFREYDGRSDLHVGITNTNGECIFIVFFFFELSPQNAQSEESSSSRKKVIVATVN